MPSLKIAKPDKDVTSSNAYDFVFNSLYPTYKVSSSGEEDFSISAHASDGHYDVTHNLGYYPFAFGYVEYGGKSYWVSGDVYTGIEVTGDSFTTAVRFYAIHQNTNTFRIGAYSVTDTVASQEDFTARWQIMLDPFEL